MQNGLWAPNILSKKLAGKAPQGPTQAISYGKGRLSQKAKLRARKEGPRALENNGWGPAELHPRGLGNTRLARFQNPHESMPAMWIPLVPFLNGSIYCNYPAPVSHCLLNVCRAYHLCHLKFSRSRGATAWERPVPIWTSQKSQDWGSQLNAVVE